MTDPLARSHRWKTGGCVVIVLLTAAFLIMVNRYNLLHPGYVGGVVKSVYHARYNLGRWPHSWEEVRANRWGLPAPGMLGFDRIEVQPIDAIECRVEMYGTNVIGFRYTVSEKLTWTPEQEETQREIVEADRRLHPERK